MCVLTFNGLGGSEHCNFWAVGFCNVCVKKKLGVGDIKYGCVFSRILSCLCTKRLARGNLDNLAGCVHDRSKVNLFQIYALHGF